MRRKKGWAPTFSWYLNRLILFDIWTAGWCGFTLKGFTSARCQQHRATKLLSFTPRVGQLKAFSGSACNLWFLLSLLCLYGSFNFISPILKHKVACVISNKWLLLAKDKLPFTLLWRQCRMSNKLIWRDIGRSLGAVRDFICDWMLNQNVAAPFCCDLWPQNISMD